MNLTICPFCANDNIESFVSVKEDITFIGGSFYIDDQGKYHDHSRNKTTLIYTCQNGHSWKETNRHTCWCGWTDGIGSLELDFENPTKNA